MINLNLRVTLTSNKYAFNLHTDHKTLKKNVTQTLGKGLSVASLEGSIKNYLITQQKRLAVTYFFSGAMTYFFCAFIDPLFGSLLILLAVINLLIDRRWVFIMNSLALNTIAIVTFGYSINFVLEIERLTILPTLAILLGLVEVSWGIQSFRNFTHIRKASYLLKSK